ncbi:MAG: DUF4956 domain-containing protein [Salinivirgaceae bacterium]|nr:MAG: DUF4956 domain-containing protein [Salinivirgaceae bacterium]
MNIIQSILHSVPLLNAGKIDLELFNIDIIDVKDFSELIIRFLFNLLISFIIVKVLYYNTSKRKDYLFTYMLISVVVFLLCFLLENVKLELGFALGLFAIFGIIRYRTITIPIKEMTYLFIIIGLSVINALANKKVSYAELIFTNLAVVAVVYMLERVWLLKHEGSKIITYEKIDLIKPENYQLLILDLKERTGLEINRVEIGKINFLRDTAEVKIYYFNGINSMENEEEYYSINDEKQY